MPFLRRIMELCLIAVVPVILAGPAGAQGTPLYEQPPFDTLTIKPEFGGGTFKMLPLGLRNGLTPSPLPREGTLTVTFADEPDDKYEVEWSAIAAIITYHEAVFAELQQQLRRGAFDAAHGYFDYLFRNAPNFPGLQDAYESMLMTEARQYLRTGDTQNMTARFERLYAENKTHAELRQLWSSQIDAQLAALMQHENCDEMRAILTMFEERYPDNEVNKKWFAAIQRLAQSYVTRAGECYAARQYLEAYDGIENARRVLGDPDALRDVERSLKALCPRIVVAVSESANLPVSIFPMEDQLVPSNDMPVPLTGATIRSRRLLQHTLVEYSGSGIDGGIYSSPLGLFSDVMFSETETGFEWTLHEDLKWASDGQTMTAFDLAETLERLCFHQNDTDAHGHNYMIEQLFREIDVIDSRTVRVRLNRESLFPESRLREPLSRSQSIAFMGVSYTEENVPDDQRDWNGPYRLKRFEPRSPERNRHFDRAFYQRNANDSLSMNDKPGVLVEQTLPAGSDAMQLLLEGKIDLVEHVPPDRVAAYRLQSKLVLGNYAAPRVHFLLPNRNKPGTSSRTFLRGMLYGLDRDWMLRQLLGDNASDGTVLSAPLPKRTKADDPFGYAYNDRIIPRPYEPKLAVALAVTAYNQVKSRELKRQLAEQQEVAADLRATEGDDETALTAQNRDLHGYLALVPDELVLACPPNDTARNACLMIQQQWRTVGIPVRIVEYRPNERVGRGTDVDFWYVEMTMLEPCVDLELLFGNNGMVTHRSEYIEQAMSHVRLARNWQEAVEALENLHRVIYNETTVLPLWQINGHFAHRHELSGVPDEVFCLYDQVEQWRLEEN
ncbi:MAG: ABC transporter substrate-binding protein [Planctomycetaceae bacterium]|nr:ABC transporter substrate-binding protein [Planctomycetaceae bacterium]